MKESELAEQAGCQERMARWNMARIVGVPAQKASLTTRIAYWLCRRRLGKVVEPRAIVAHHRWLAKGYGAFEFASEKSRLVDGRLKALAQIKVAHSDRLPVLNRHRLCP